MSPPRRPTLLVSLLAVLLALPGCFRMRARIELGAGGEATQSVSLSLTAAAFGRLERAAAGLDIGDGRRADPTRIFERAAVERELADLDLELRDYHAARDGGRHEVDLEVACPDFAALRRSPVLGSRTEWYAFPGRNPGNVRVVCYLLGSAAWRSARERSRALADQPDDVRHRFLEAQQRQLRGLDLQFELSVPGDVDYTSPNVEVLDDGRSVRLQVRAADLRSAEDVVHALAPRIEVEFAGAGVELPMADADPGLVEQPDAADH